MLDITVTSLLALEVDVADEVHDIRHVDAVALHQLDAEVYIVKHRYNLFSVVVLAIKKEVFALVVLILLVGHIEVASVKAELYEGLERQEITCQLSEKNNELFLIILGIHHVDGCRRGSELFDLCHKLIELLCVEFKGLCKHTFRLSLREQSESIVCFLFEVSVAYDNAPRLCFFLNTVCTAVRLKQIVVHHILVNIEDGQGLAIEAGQEHIYDEKDIKRLALFALYTVGDILVVSCESIRAEVGVIHLVVISNDSFESISRMLVSSFIVLIRAVGENTADIEVVIDGLEDVIILYKLRN